MIGLLHGQRISPQSQQGLAAMLDGIRKMTIKARYLPLSFTRESQIIVAICLVDLAVTLALLSSSTAREGNPLMNFYLEFGVGAFVIAKLCLLFLPIFVAEWCRQFRPQFVRRMLRLTIVAYLGTYTLLFLQHNVPVILADHLYDDSELSPPRVRTAHVISRQK